MIIETVLKYLHAAMLRCPEAKMRLKNDTFLINKNLP